MNLPNSLQPELTDRISSDEDNPSDDDEMSANAELPVGGRRRFCNERKVTSNIHEHGTPQESKVLTHNLDEKMTAQHPGYGRIRGKCLSRRPHPYRAVQSRRNDRNPNWKSPVATSKVYSSTVSSTIDPKLAGHGPENTVIYINPAFIRKFAEKSKRLTTTAETQQSIDSSSAKTDEQDPSKDYSSNVQTESFSKESLHQATTMAVIRLVTECIEDDSKRNESMNRSLAEQLLEKIQHHAQSKNKAENQPKNSADQ